MVTNLIRGVILGFFAFCLFRYCSQENRVPWSSARKPAHQSGDIAVGYLTSKTVNTIGTQKERKLFYIFGSKNSGQSGKNEVPAKKKES